MTDKDDEEKKMSEKRENQVKIELSGTKWDFFKIHTTVQVSGTTNQTFQWPLRENSGKYLEMVGNPGSEIVHDIMAIEGIVYLSIERYKIVVTHGMLFDQVEIAEAVLKIVEKYLAPESVTGATWREEPSAVEVESN